MLTDVIADIEAHLAWREARGARMAEATFGLQAVNDGKLVHRLRSGSQITVKTLQAVNDFIARDRKTIAAAKAEQGAAA